MVGILVDALRDNLVTVACDQFILPQQENQLRRFFSIIYIMRKCLFFITSFYSHEFLFRTSTFHKWKTKRYDFFLLINSLIFTACTSKFTTFIKAIIKKKIYSNLIMSLTVWTRLCWCKLVSFSPIVLLCCFSYSPTDYKIGFRPVCVKKWEQREWLRAFKTSTAYTIAISSDELSHCLATFLFVFNSSRHCVLLRTDHAKCD